MSFFEFLKGPKGDKGDRGSTGETGPKGDKGETGISDVIDLTDIQAKIDSIILVDADLQKTIEDLSERVSAMAIPKSKRKSSTK